MENPYLMCTNMVEYNFQNLRKRLAFMKDITPYYNAGYLGCSMNFLMLCLDLPLFGIRVSKCKKLMFSLDEIFI